MDPETLSANKMVLRQLPPLLLIAVIAVLGEGGLYLARGFVVIYCITSIDEPVFLFT